MTTEDRKAVKISEYLKKEKVNLLPTFSFNGKPGNLIQRTLLRFLLKNGMQIVLMVQLLSKVKE